MKSKKTNTPFRFPFDINTKIFLGLALFFFILSFDSVRERISPQHNIPKYKIKLEEYIEDNISEFKNILQDTSLCHEMVHNNIEETQMRILSQRPYSIFIFSDKTDSLLFWNSNEIIPNPRLKAEVAPIVLRKGKYIQYKQILNSGGQRYKAICVLKLKNENPFNSENFKVNFVPCDSENDFGMQLSTIELLDSEPINYRSTPIYHIYKKDDFLNINDSSGWRLFFNCLPFILFGVSIHTYFKVEVKNKKPIYIFLALLALTIGIRSLSYLFSIPTDFSFFELFDSRFFATDFLNKSIGDTFVNMCLLFWISLFYVVNVQGKILHIKKQKTEYKIAFGIIIFTALVISTIYFSNLVYEIINDSVINFDTTIFNQLKVSSFIGLLTFMVIFANFFILVIITNNYFNDCFKTPYLKFILLIISYLVFLTFYKVAYPICYHYAFVCIGGILALLDRPNFRLRFDFNSYILLSWMIIISAVGALILTKFISEKEEANRAIYASKLFAVEDKQLEDKIELLAESISSDTSIITQIEQKSEDKINQIEEYILNNYIENKFSKYKLYLHIFDKKNENINPTDSIKSIDKTIFKSAANFVTENSFSILRVVKSNKEKGYEALIPILENNNERGSVLLELKKNIFSAKDDYGDFVYQDEIMKRANEHSYSVGIYDSGFISFKTGSFEFPLKIQKKDIPKSGKGLIREKDGYSALYFNDEANAKFLIVAKPLNRLYLFTTLFAYIFLTYFFTLTLYILGNIVARSNLNFTRFINLLNINLRLKIHIAIIVLSAISFTVIGLSISNFIINRMVGKNKNQIVNYSQSLQDDLNRYLSKNNVHSLNQLHPLLHQAEHIDQLKKLVARFRTNINIFDPNNGDLLFSSDNTIIRNGLLAPKLNPIAFNRIRRDNKSQFVDNEYIGDLNYLAAYSFLTNENRENLAVLQIPYISANAEIKSETTTIIITLLNIFVMVFLVSSALALFLTNSVTQPFRYIVKQFTKINLSKTNEPLKWRYSDEIGLLVKEYNRMLRKLENSTMILAKTEREMAWREMAKQVAHEIKNPLTPMKLSLQMLERAIKNNNPNINEITARVTGTLIEQIDNLTLIATNFSNFAKMPEMKREYFVLNDVLYTVTGMYNDDINNEFLFLIPDYNINVYADKSQLIRVFTNIVQNAIQAIPDNRKGNISMQVSKGANNMIRVSISDNGEGIDTQKGKKLFQPYFTTKSSGTGLGLAMCKDIIEQFGGKIWFESEVDEGSTFHIELPVVDQADIEEDSID